MPTLSDNTIIVNDLYDIYLEVFSSSEEKSLDKFGNKTLLNEYSKPINQNKENLNTFIQPIPIGRSEVFSSKYRNGILDQESLSPSILDRKITVQPGMYKIDNNEFYLSWQNLIDNSPALSSVEELDLEEIRDPGVINFISYLSYKRTGNTYQVNNWGYNRNEIEPYLPFFETQENTSQLYINQKLFDDPEDINSLFIGHKLKNISETGIPTEYSYIFGEFIGSNYDENSSPVLKTKYFPIGIPGMPSFDFGEKYTNIVVRNQENDTLELWAVAETLYDMELYAAMFMEGKCCYLDRIQGKFFFHPTYLEKEIHILDNLEAGVGKIVTTDLPVKSSFGFGIIEPGTEKEEVIRFIRIDDKRILVLWHGQDHEANVPIVNKTYSVAPIGEVFAAYHPVFRTQKEFTIEERFPLSKEVEPWIWSNQRTIAVLSKDKLIPFKISLEALDVPYKGLSDSVPTWGPVNNNNESVLLRGRVLTLDNKPVPNQEVRTYIVAGSGRINEEEDSTAITNDEGYFYAAYNPRYTDRWITFDRNHVSYQGNQTLLLLDQTSYDKSLYPSNAESIVYLITKDEGTIGTRGMEHVVDYSLYLDMTEEEKDILGLTSRAIGTGEIATVDNTHQGFFLLNFFTDENTPESYIDGYILPVLNESERSNKEDLELEKYKITNIIKTSYIWEGISGAVPLATKENTYLVLIEGNPEISPFRIAKFYLFQKDDIDFDYEEMNGRKSVLIKNTDNEIWKHPEANVETNKILIPVTTNQFNKISGSYIVNEKLPLISSQRKNNNAGFAIIPPVQTVIRSETFSDDTLIQSNLVKIEVSNLNRDKGIITNKLGTIKVPYGFRLYDSYSEDSSTLDTETFLSINNLPGISYGGEGWPFLSYVNENGIIYLDGNGDNPIIQVDNQISNIDFSIAIED